MNVNPDQSAPFLIPSARVMDIQNKATNGRVLINQCFSSEILFELALFPICIHAYKIEA